jgi:galactokinase
MNDAKTLLADTTLAGLHQAIEREFNERFGRPPSLVVAAPGRVNLIGEHIDYNDGFVLPLALDRYVLIAAAPRGNGEGGATIRLHSRELGETETIATDQKIRPGRSGWVCYAEGVLAGFAELGEPIPAFDALLGSTVPVGGGLSSSAALEVATATVLEQLTGRFLDLRQKALLCQKAEHEFAGVPCGIMDQFSSVFGKPDQLMLIDCRSQDIQPVSFDASEISVLITNSNVKHELNGGEYAARRSQCESALAKIGKASWRDVSPEDLERADGLSEVQRRRARHVVSEIRRTVEAAEAFRQSDWQTAGRLMDSSHDSLRDDFEVSCAELDTLVEIARDIGEAGGVIGSRMTGGGFGGCTVTLVSNDRLDSVKQTLSSRYEAATGIKPHLFSSRPALGAHVLKGK